MQQGLRVAIFIVQYLGQQHQRFRFLFLLLWHFKYLFPFSFNRTYCNIFYFTANYNEFLPVNALHKCNNIIIIIIIIFNAHWNTVSVLEQLNKERTCATVAIIQVYKIEVIHHYLRYRIWVIFPASCTKLNSINTLSIDIFIYRYLYRDTYIEILI